MQFLAGRNVGSQYIGERLQQDAAKRHAERVDVIDLAVVVIDLAVVVIDLAVADRHVERRDRRPQRERMPLGDERGETGEEGGGCVRDRHWPDASELVAGLPGWVLGVGCWLPVARCRLPSCRLPGCRGSSARGSGVPPRWGADL